MPAIDSFTPYLLSRIPEIDEIILKGADSHIEHCRSTHAPFGYRFAPARMAKNNTTKTGRTTSAFHNNRLPRPDLVAVQIIATAAGTL
jgi:hypothetical protein